MTAEQFRYDELNRIKSSSFSVYQNGQFVNKDDYATSYTYDGNGNILSLHRNAYKPQGSALQLEMDRLTYRYYPGTNRLRRVEDAVTTADWTEDIENQTGDQDGNNYVYDQIGQLTHDEQDKTTITWTMYGKIKSVTKTDGSQRIDYFYDPTGNRSSKTVTRGSEVKTTYYVRDSQGVVLSVYERSTSEPVAKQSEVYVYGNVRLGVYKPLNRTVNQTAISSRELGSKEYELTDHLGNVRAVVGDEREGGGSAPIRAALKSYYNYFAFGMPQTGRNYYGTQYRFGGFNGKEKDPEFGNTYDYGNRIYDARTGRFLSRDPLAMNYPWYSSYQFAGNKPIAFIDVEGGQEGLAIQQNQDAKDLYQKKATAKEIMLRNRARGTGALIGAGIVLTGGAIIKAGPAAGAYLASLGAWANANPQAVKEIGSFGAGVIGGLAGYDGDDIIPDSKFDEIGKVLTKGGKYVGDFLHYAELGLRSYYAKIGSDKIFVGGAQFVKGFLSFSINTNDVQAANKLINGTDELGGLGTKIFDDAFEKAGGFEKVRGIQGIWSEGPEYAAGASDNLIEFNKYLKAHPGATLEEAALKGTWTGRRSAGKGYTNVIVKDSKKNDDGTYKAVEVVFMKPVPYGQ